MTRLRAYVIHVHLFKSIKQYKEVLLTKRVESGNVNDCFQCTNINMNSLLFAANVVHIGKE